MGWAETNTNRKHRHANKDDPFTHEWAASESVGGLEQKTMQADILARFGEHKLDPAPHNRTAGCRGTFGGDDSSPITVCMRSLCGVRGGVKYELG